ncbi:MAG: cation transporter [Deltaproteobacteria bacterium]|nr:MAG: cation transporter [Deltaproteobacteria bacterium]
MAKPTSLARFAWLSIATALATIALKAIAYVMTGSVGLLSDALESLVNLVAAVLALLMLSVSARPPDEDHAYGHTKAEYFASGAEGVLILVAAVAIGWAAVLRLLEPRALEKVGLGLVVSTFASILNFLAARILLAAGRRYRSIALEADAQHLLTDVWTSAGVLVAVGAVSVTGWQRLDPIIALLVAVNIVRTGVSLVKRSAVALLDVAWAPPEQEVLRSILQKHERPEVKFHAIRTRQAGARRFVSLHVLVPGRWTVAQGHDLSERIESEIRSAVPHSTVETHIEPLEDPASWEDQDLDRIEEPPAS